MIGTEYWATGIVCKYRKFGGWAASLTFLDSGFCNDDAQNGRVSTEGTLHTRYYVADGPTVNGLTAALDAVIADAARLGIRLGMRGRYGPSLYVDGGGEDPGVDLPPDWREQLAAQSARLGWEPTYAWRAVNAQAALNRASNPKED